MHEPCQPQFLAVTTDQATQIAKAHAEAILLSLRETEEFSILIPTIQNRTELFVNELMRELELISDLAKPEMNAAVWSAVTLATTK